MISSTNRKVPMSYARPVLLAASLVIVGALAGCTSSDSDDPADATHSVNSPAPGPEADGLPLVPPEAGHVHGMAVNPADGLLYLGTHSGTLVLDGDTISQVGDSTIDLMGFTAAGANHFYASGHPGPHDDLPNPVGLIESTDGGRTWTPLSHLGESDFHTVGAAGEQVYGFNGQLLVTDNGADWVPGASDVAPVSLAVDPGGPGRVVATTEQGPVLSEDGGKSFVHLDGAPLLLFVAWPSSEALWGVSPDGSVYVSADAGGSWDARGQVDVPTAFTAGQDGSVVVATETQILSSGDRGQTFEPVAHLSTGGH